MNKSEATLAVHALLAVSPSGGGSQIYTLARKLMTEYNIEPVNSWVVELQQRAAKELQPE